MNVARQVWALRRDVAGALVYWSGLGRAFERLKSPEGAIILMYHSVAADAEAKYVDPRNRISPALFEKQMAFLSRHRRVVALSDLVNWISEAATPPSGTVCITFDDGYLDNFTIAAPILEKYRLPATVFLATGYIERCETQWADLLHWMFQCRTRDELTLPEIGLPGTNLRTRRGRISARNTIHPRLLEAKYDARASLLQEIEEQLRPAGSPPRLTLSWDEVRALQRRYPFFEIGGHTRFHIDLRTHIGDTARSQISDCAEDLWRELGVRPGHFSFPYSRWCQETRGIVRDMGWQSAVGMGDAVRITGQSERYAMPRVEAPRNMTLLRFRTSGAYPGSLSMLRCA